ncbi:endonuclease/exonuclease/phosphatase family protein [Streptomyces sp. NPDC058319]|uniref:endonuclease/exonuclease/phosphatase family protein n=1 Tax=unclassified Streptomyces TaxID=2593676 RepID=UPI00144AD716|nr:endonuclease/exonuclease/phosphatase family protein [Streptomyces sp. SAT1]
MTVSVSASKTPCASDTTDTCAGPDSTGVPEVSRRWRRGRIASAAALPVVLLLVGHRLVPDGPGHLGSLAESFLPWTALVVPVLLLCALLRRSATAVVAAAVAAAVWGSVFGGTLVDKGAERTGGGDLTVVTHNVDEHNPDPAGTARALAASGADVVALEELGDATETYRTVLAARYRYAVVRGTVGLWSRYPVDDGGPVDIAPWPRALRATVHTPKGPVAVFVAHLLSVRFTPASGFGAGARNAAALRLAEALRAETPPRLVVVGDFNGTTDDRALAPVTAGLRSAQAEAGAGFGFSWPAAFPVARIDQILVRGVEPRSAWSLPATGSDHLPVAASLRL